MGKNKERIILRDSSILHYFIDKIGGSSGVHLTHDLLNKFIVNIRKCKTTFCEIVTATAIPFWDGFGCNEKRQIVTATAIPKRYGGDSSILHYLIDK